MDSNLFTKTVDALRYGSLAEELTEKLNEVIQTCERTQKSGAITLSLKVKPSKAGRVEITDDIKLTLPKEEKGSSIMFVTPEGNLQREDPRQATIGGLRSVEQTIQDKNALRNLADDEAKQELRKVG